MKLESEIAIDSDRVRLFRSGGGRAVGSNLVGTNLMVIESIAKIPETTGLPPSHSIWPDPSGEQS